MTLQSSSSNSEIVSASGPSSTTSSTSTSSTDVFPLPYSIGHKEIVLNNEARTVVADVGENNILSTPGANVSIVESSDVHLGNRTNFNGEVTIYQYINGPNIPNGSVGQDEVECKKTDRVNSQRNKNRTLYKCRYLFIPFIFLLLLLLILITLFIFRNSIFNSAPNFPPIDPETNSFILGHPVYYKHHWGALPEKELSPLLPTPTTVVIISHTATEGCSNFTECANITQHLQYNDMKRGHRDIGYNFLIGGEGGIYVGRGWGRQNSLRVKSISISFIGDFNKQMLSDIAQDSAQDLLEEGVRTGMLDENYKLVGENQTSPLRFYSPGRNTVEVIKNWGHYFPGTML